MNIGPAGDDPVEQRPAPAAGAASAGAARACPSLEALEDLAAGMAGAAVDSAGLREHLERCPACRRHLETIERNNALLDELGGAGALAAPPDASAPCPPPHIDGYDFVREIQRGAQGVVWEAVQRSTRRRVAIKVIASGAFATTRQRMRFEREAELVAALRHPNVVTVHDSGTTGDGGAFLVMEYVDGRPLEAQLAEQGPPRDRAAVRGRVDLFAGICAAVAAAHQRAIIHRDLKPANVMIDSAGQPQVLDFGIARRAGPAGAEQEMATMAGEFLGTLAYASPEQVSGDPGRVDVRSDVYALGVMLFEMLAGRRPWLAAGSIGEAIEKIRYAEPPRLHELNRAVGGELETIAMKALAKDPDRRYDSAAALLADVRHLLAGEPIDARRDSHWYLLRKTLARHRVAVSVAAAFVLLVIAAAVVMTVLYRESARNEQHATETLASFLGVLGSERLRWRVDEQTLPELLAEADRAIGAQLDDHPEAAARLRREIGLAQLNLGAYEDAARQLALALELQRSLHEPPHAALADALHDHGRALWWLGRHAEAEAAYREALAMRQALPDQPPQEIAMTMSHLAAALRQQARYGEAESLYRQALDLRRRVSGPGREAALASGLNSLGLCLRDQQRDAEALPLLEEALVMIRAAEGPDHAYVGSALHNVALCLADLGRWDEARVALDDALATKLGRYEEHHPAVASSRAVEARLALAHGDVATAEALARQALHDQEAAYGPSHVDVAETLALLGRILLEGDRAGEAAPLLERAVQIRRVALPPGHWKLRESEEMLRTARG